VTLPATLTVTDGSRTALTSLSVADAAGGAISTSLTIGAGTLEVEDSHGATVTGNGTNALNVSGTVAAVSDTPLTLVYTAPVNSATTQTLTLAANDAIDGAADTLTLTVRDRPDIGGLAGQSLAYTPGAKPMPLDGKGAAVVNDLDSTDFNGGSLTVRI